MIGMKRLPRLARQGFKGMGIRMKIPKIRRAKASRPPNAERPKHEGRKHQGPEASRWERPESMKGRRHRERSGARAAGEGKGIRMGHEGQAHEGRTHQGQVRPERIHQDPQRVLRRGSNGALRRRSGPRIHPASPGGCGGCRLASPHVSFGHQGASASTAARGAWGGLREGGEEKKKPPWEGMKALMEGDLDGRRS